MTIRRQIPAPDPPGCHDTTIDALTDGEVESVLRHEGPDDGDAAFSWLFSLACEVKHLREQNSELRAEVQDLERQLPERRS